MESNPNIPLSQPELPPHEDAIVREMMMHDGISYAEARKNWEMMKAEVNKQLFDKKREDEQNG